MTHNVDILIATIRRDLEAKGWSRNGIDAYLIGYLAEFLKRAADVDAAIRRETEWCIRYRNTSGIRGELDAGGVMGQPG